LKIKRFIPALFRISTILIISSAALVRADITSVGPDTTTQGSWNGKFGQDGFLIANGASSMPSYGNATVSGAATYTWAGLTSDVRALQSGAGSSTRIASSYYANNFNINVSVSDGGFHPVSLYFLDWDTTSRAQTVTVMDAGSSAVLDTQSITAFNSGKYFTWNVRGNVRINITALGGGSAVLSGVFFGLNVNAAAPPPAGGGATTSATPIGPDTSTQGSWKGKYGSDGYYVANGASQAPSYGSATVTGAATFTWGYNTTDQRALQNVDPILGPIRTASTYYGNNLNVNVNITDGNSHQVSLYLLDWDHSNQAETINVYDAGTGALLDSQALAGFGDGKYFSWTIKGNVRISVGSIGYTYALVSGIFFGAGGTISSGPATPAATGSAATWVGLDTTTQGTWTGKYGAAGYLIANGPTVTPSYANASVVLNPFNYTWASYTTDVRALQLAAGSPYRIASTYGTYKISYFEVHATITDGNAHNVSLYLLSWDSVSRPESVSVLDAGTGQVLDFRTFDNYHDGVWATWNVKGNVVFRVTPIGEIYAAASGVFFN
jgi:hypothetical protein